MESLQLKRKTLERLEWTRVTRRRSFFLPWQEGSLQGQSALIEILELEAPIVIAREDWQVCTADVGYSWLQLAPQGEHWWLTAMFDPQDRFIQAYVDITLENNFDDPRRPYMVDLFLDLVFLDDGRSLVLDGEELSAARAQGLISPAEEKLAWESAKAFLAAAKGRQPQFRAYLLEQLKRLRAQGQSN